MLDSWHTPPFPLYYFSCFDNSCMYMLSHSVMSASFATTWTVACQAPLTMRFSRQEYWSVLLFPLLGDLSHPGIESVSPVSPGRQIGRQILYHGASWQAFDNSWKWKWNRSVLSNSLRPRGLCSPPGSSVHGILQARILEWVAISFSRGIFLIQGWNPGLRIAVRHFNLRASREAPDNS